MAAKNREGAYARAVLGLDKLRGEQLTSHNNYKIYEKYYLGRLNHSSLATTRTEFL